MHGGTPGLVRGRRERSRRVANPGIEAFVCESLVTPIGAARLPAAQRCSEMRVAAKPAEAGALAIGSVSLKP